MSNPIPAMTMAAAEQNPTIIACEMKLTRKPKLKRPKAIKMTPVRNVKLTARIGSDDDSNGGDSIGHVSGRTQYRATNIDMIAVGPNVISFDVPSKLQS